MALSPPRSPVPSTVAYSRIDDAPLYRILRSIRRYDKPFTALSVEAAWITPRISLIIIESPLGAHSGYCFAQGIVPTASRMTLLVIRLYVRLTCRTYAAGSGDPLVLLHPQRYIPTNEIGICIILTVPSSSVNRILGT